MEKEEYQEKEEWDEQFVDEDEELAEREEEETYGLDPAFGSWADYYRYMYG